MNHRKPCLIFRFFSTSGRGICKVFNLDLVRSEPFNDVAKIIISKKNQNKQKNPQTKTKRETSGKSYISLKLFSHIQRKYFLSQALRKLLHLMNLKSISGARGFKQWTKCLVYSCLPPAFRVTVGNSCDLLHYQIHISPKTSWSTSFCSILISAEENVL